MCWLCDVKERFNRPPQGAQALSVPHLDRRRWVLGTAALTGMSALHAQVDVGEASALRNLVPADKLEDAARLQYQDILNQAREKKALAPDDYPQLVRLRQIARRLIPYTTAWNDRASDWQWEINLIGSREVNAFCMPGGKIVFYTGILSRLELSEDETAMVMGHEMAHALREHARARLAKTQATSWGLSIGAQLLGLGNLGNLAADLGAQLLSLKFSREDETEADLVGLELAARGAFNPNAGVSLWQKMLAQNGSGGPAFLSTHPSGPNRIKELQSNVPRVLGLYQAARK